MRYESQKIAYKFFTAAVLLFGVQILMGIIAALQFIKPDLIIIPFNIIRSLHINALVVWLLLGLMGATYYVVPEESETELWSQLLAELQFWATVIVVGLVVIGYIIMGLNPQMNKVIFGTTLLNEGREYIEAPRWADILIVISVLAFLLNNFMTVLKTGKWTSVQGVLLAGLTMLALMYLPGVFFTPSISNDQFWWWWVIHLWVEGSWEVIAGALLCFMLMKLTGAKREELEKYMYIEVGLVLFTGILGLGHHYYWIGTPPYWLWVGGIFSALEPIPLLLMVWDAFKIANKYERTITNKTAKYFVIGHALFNFIGAGIFGVIHTLPVINKWTHGTQVTTAHGHLAFYGAYALLVLSMIYIVIPELKGFREFNYRRGLLSFWIMTISMLFIAFTLLGAGMMQSVMERMMGLDYTTVKTVYNMPFWIFRAIFGFAFLAGALVFIQDYFIILSTKNQRV